MQKKKRPFHMTEHAMNDGFVKCHLPIGGGPRQTGTMKNISKERLTGTSRAKQPSHSGVTAVLNHVVAER
jgi:hypothetical protein